MEQILNQRYIYKINSAFLQRNKWDIRLTDINEGIKQRFIVSIGDSWGLRTIRDINHSLYTEDYIDNIKYELNKVKRNKEGLPKRLLKKRIKELNKRKYESMLENSICNVDFSTSNGHSKKQYYHAVENGFYINNEKYVFLLGTTGGIKNSNVLFCKQSIHDELMKRMINGADLSVPMLPSKLIAYLALCFSSSTPVTNGNILVIEDVEASFDLPVTFAKFDKETKDPIIEHIENYHMTNNVCDGCGLISLEMAEQWSKDLHFDYISSGFCCRHSYTKGMLIRFDFKKYCKEVLKTQYIKDVWGKIHNIDDIDFILNESMMKLHKSYKSIDHFMQCSKENGHVFSVTKSVPRELEKERMMNYQYLQCLDLSEDDIRELLKYNIKEIQDIMGLDSIKTILYSRGTQLNEKNAWSHSKDNLYSNALMVDGESAMKDDYIKYRIKKSIAKRIRMLKTGKIRLEGNYQISCGEPVMLLEKACGFEPKGLLQGKEYYIEYWREKGIKQVGAFRSPMSCKENAVVMEICHREEVIKWYGDLKNLIVFNPRTPDMARLNGQDHDSDMDYSTPHPIIIKGIQDLPPIVCEDESGQKKSNPTKQDFIESIIRGFGCPVGTITNQGSSIYPLLEQYPIGTPERTEIEKRLTSIQLLQQNSLDAIKTGNTIVGIPNHWTNYNSPKLQYRVDEDGVILDSKEEMNHKDMLKKLVTDKKPYFFRYIYQNSNSEYIKFIKETNSNSVRKFGVEVEKLKNKLIKTEEELEFLNNYNRNTPLNCSKSIVNMIAWEVEKQFDIPNTKVKRSEFDYSIYKQNGNNYIGTASEKKKIKELYEEYKSKSNQRILAEYNDKSDSAKEISDRDEEFKNSIEEVIPNRQELLNVLLEMSYKKASISRGMVWLLVGDLMVNNMLENNNRKIKYPIQDEDGDIEYHSIKFKLVEQTIEKGKE